MDSDASLLFGAGASRRFVRAAWTLEARTPVVARPCAHLLHNRASEAPACSAAFSCRRDRAIKAAAHHPRRRQFGFLDRDCSRFRQLLTFALSCRRAIARAVTAACG
jgi:hypothetical protein